MVKYETFNLCVVGSNPTGLKYYLYLKYLIFFFLRNIIMVYYSNGILNKNAIVINGHRLMVDLLPSK